MVLALAGIIVATGIVSSGALKSYQKDRLTVFVQQDNNKATQTDKQGAAYNLDQAKIAIGHGGFWGRGLFNGSQTRTGQVPEQDTDFIFTAAAEQFGFVGAGVILALMGLMVVRVWRTAQLARDDFGTYVCVGVLAMLLFQIFENVGMTMGIMPITGIPLPSCPTAVLRCSPTSPRSAWSSTCTHAASPDGSRRWMPEIFGTAWRRSPSITMM